METSLRELQQNLNEKDRKIDEQRQSIRELEEASVCREKYVTEVEDRCLNLSTRNDTPYVIVRNVAKENREIMVPQHSTDMFEKLRRTESQTNDQYEEFVSSLNQPFLVQIIIQNFPFPDKIKDLQDLNDQYKDRIEELEANQLLNPREENIAVLLQELQIKELQDLNDQYKDRIEELEANKPPNLHEENTMAPQIRRLNDKLQELQTDVQELQTIVQTLQTALHSNRDASSESDDIDYEFYKQLDMKIPEEIRALAMELIGTLVSELILLKDLYIPEHIRLQIELQYLSKYQSKYQFKYQTPKQHRSIICGLYKQRLGPWGTFI